MHEGPETGGGGVVERKECKKKRELSSDQWPSGEGVYPKEDCIK